MNKLRGRGFRKQVCKLAQAATLIIHIWLDENARIHNGKIRSEAVKGSQEVMFDVSSRQFTCKGVMNSIQNRVLFNFRRITADSIVETYLYLPLLLLP